MRSPSQKFELVWKIYLVNKNNLKTALDIDFKNIVSEFKTNITEVSATIKDYANNTSAVSNALVSMQQKIDRRVP